ncbi:hypothetical protein HK405_003324 [Cladochytrium tenue]|nr:hypothetical protein HK405_003324 [Cladochytrium tenue]
MVVAAAPPVVAFDDGITTPTAAAAVAGAPGATASHLLSATLPPPPQPLASPTSITRFDRPVVPIEDDDDDDGTAAEAALEAGGAAGAGSSEAVVQAVILLLAILPEAVTEAMLTPLYPFIVAELSRADSPSPSSSSATHVPAVVDIGARTGAFSASFYLPLLVMNVVWGASSDRFGRKGILLAGLCVGGACIAVLGGARSFALGVFCRFLAGVFGGNSTVTKGGLGELFQDGQGRSWAYSIYGSLYSIAGITGPLLGGLLVPSQSALSDESAPTPTRPSHPFLLACSFAAAITLLCTLVVFRRLREPRDVRRSVGSGVIRLERTSRRPDSGRYAQVLQDDTDGSTEEEVDTKKLAGDGNAASGSRIGMQRKVLPPPANALEAMMRALVGPVTSSVIFPIVLYMLIAFCNMAWVTALPLLHSSPTESGGLGMNPFNTSFAMTVIACSKLVTQVFLFRPLCAVLGVQGTYRVGMALVIPPCLVSGMLGGHQGVGLTWVVVMLCSMVFGVAEATSYISVIIMISDSVPTDAIGAAHGLSATMAASVRTLAPPLVGMVWGLGSRTGHPIAPFWVISAAAFMAVVASSGDSVVPGASVVKDASSSAGDGRPASPGSGLSAAAASARSRLWIWAMTVRRQIVGRISGRE